jgi:endonuclease G
MAAQDQFVAVIGYPAQDSRIPEQDLMHTIFGNQYNKKRLAPGQVTGTRSDAMLHDCSTLGGNSGSVVLSLESGKALGLHFAGRFLEANYAVPSRIVAARLAEIRRSEIHTASIPPGLGVTQGPVGAVGVNVSQSHSALGQSITYTIPLNVTVQIGIPMVAGAHQPGTGQTGSQASSEDEDEDIILTEARPEDYADRAGYDADFIGQGFTVPLPRIVRGASDVLTFEFEGETQEVLKYQHFSVVMSRSRRLCRYSAVNINGNEPRKAKRPSWRTDPRIPAGAQIMKECYGNAPKFSRGHMTRREDPIWGNQAMADRGNADSMHATNAVPQMQPFNAGIWLGLEDYALEHARRDDMRISVFTGPFLRDDDPVRYRVQIPLTFWKVMAFIHDDTGKLCATGYCMSQEDYLREEEFVFGQHKTAQVAIAWIEEQAGLSFGDLASLDPMDLVEEGPSAQLMDFRQIRFV